MATNIPGQQVEMDSIAPSFNPSQLYETIPLPTDSGNAQSIRVLDLDAESSDSSECLTGVLRIVRLEDSPKFAALSYVWGGFSNPRDVLLCRSPEGNRAKIDITSNCHAALASLRKQIGALTIWVDSVCIDQGNSREKESQIPLMKDIYTFAQPTYIWLGDGSEKAARAMCHIKLLSKTCGWTVGYPWLCRKRPISEAQEKRTLFLSYLKHLFLYRNYRYRSRRLPDDMNLSPILEHPWLDRMWTFQEIVLASDPVLFAEGCQVDWLKFYQGLLQAYKPQELENYRWYDLMRVWRSITRPVEWNGVVRRQIPKNQPWSVHKYCQVVGNKKLYDGACAIAVISHLCPLLVATEASLYFNLTWDKIHHRVLGLALVFGSGFAILIVLFIIFRKMFRANWVSFGKLSLPDYSSKGFVEVIRTLRERQVTESKDRSSAVYAVLERLSVTLPNPDLSISLEQRSFELYRTLIIDAPETINLLVDSGGHNINGPSWVQNWDTLKELTWFPDKFIYEALASRDVSPYCKVDGEKLIIKGVFVDKIKFVSNIIPRLQTSEEVDYSPLIQFSMEIYKWLWLLFYTGTIIPLLMEPLAISVFQALSFPEEYPAKDRNMFESWYQKIIVQLVQKYHRGQPGLESAIKQFIHEHDDIIAFQKSICKLGGGKGRLLFSPNYGPGTAGIAGIADEDDIVMVDGVSMPLILRETNKGSGEYKLFGPCFMPLLHKNTGEPYFIPQGDGVEIVLV